MTLNAQQLLNSVLQVSQCVTLSYKETVRNSV